MTNRKLMGLFISLMIIMNTCYLGIELYKDSIRDQWMNNENIAQESFIKLSQLGNWTVIIEFTLLTSIILVSIWLIMKRNENLTNFILINIAICAFFFAFGFLTAALFEAPKGNLVQKLLGPSFILIVLAVYQGIKMLFVIRNAINN